MTAAIPVEEAQVKKALLPVLVLLCGCAGHDVSQSDEIAKKVRIVRDEVSRVVPDAGRREKLQAALDRFGRELEGFSRSASKLQESLHALNADPDASRAQFTQLIDRYEGERKSYRMRLTQIHFELLALTTDEEWRAISKHEASAVQVDDPAKAEEAK